MKTKTLKKHSVYRVLATSLHDAPYAEPSLRGEYLKKEDAQAHIDRWGKNGDSAFIQTESRESGYLFSPLE